MGEGSTSPQRPQVSDHETVTLRACGRIVGRETAFPVMSLFSRSQTAVTGR